MKYKFKIDSTINDKYINLLLTQYNTDFDEYAIINFDDSRNIVNRPLINPMFIEMGILSNITDLNSFSAQSKFYNIQINT